MKKLGTLFLSAALLVMAPGCSSDPKETKI